MTWHRYLVCPQAAELEHAEQAMVVGGELRLSFCGPDQLPNTQRAAGPPLVQQGNEPPLCAEDLLLLYQALCLESWAA